MGVLFYPVVRVLFEKGFVFTKDAKGLHTQLSGVIFDIHRYIMLWREGTWLSFLNLFTL